MTFLREKDTAPLASVVVTIIGSISGVSPMAMDTANRNASNQSPLVKPFISNTIGAITIMKRIISQLTLFTPAWNALACDLLPSPLPPVRQNKSVAGCDHYGPCSTADHIGTHEADVIQFNRIVGRAVYGWSRNFRRAAIRLSWQTG